MNNRRVFSSLVAGLVLGLILGSGPAEAFRMIQNQSVGRVTTGARVLCDDPGGFVHWTTAAIGWRHNTALQGAGKAAALQSAMASWTAVAGANHTLTYDGTTSAGWATDGVNTLLWANGNGCVWPCLALTALVLQPGQVIVESDVTFNNSVAWNLNGTNFDTEAVAAHELGHALGIHHTELTTNPQPTMAGNYFGAAGRTLEADDRAALLCSQQRYPVDLEVCPDAGPPAFDGLGTILTSTAMQNVAGTCRPHLGDFNGDGRMDVLRSCDSAANNALFYGSPGGIGSYGYVLTGSVLQDSADSCRLHLGDFNGDTRTDLLRSCNDAAYNYLWHGSGSGFVGQGYVLTGSVLQDSADSCRLHLGDFNGDTRTDLLRSCNDPAYNYLWHGSSGGFVGQGYVLTGSMLQNSSDSCRLHLGDFNGDARVDLLRSCNDATYNSLWHGSGGGFIGQGYVLTGSVLQDSADSCRLHLGDFNGDTRTDLLRSCNTPGYNHLWRSDTSGFTGLGYVLTGSVLQNKSGTCRVHLADFDGDLRDDVFRTCDDPCFNFMFRGTSSGYLDEHGYTVQESVLQYANGACRLRVGDFSGDGRADAFRTCNDPGFNALWQGVP